MIKPDSMNDPLEKRFGRIAAQNQKAYERAFSETQMEE